MDKDKSFWDHGTWKEEDAADEDYEFEDEKDVVDSDFDDAEEEEEEAPVESARRGRGKKKVLGGGRGYVDPAQRAAARKRAAATVGSKKIANRKPSRAPVPARQRMFRASTQSRVAQSAAVRKAATAKQLKDAAKRRARHGPPVKVERLTQEELLRQAAHTEIVNRRSLELMLRMEDDKKKQTGPNAPYVGPLIRFRSRIGEPNILTFEQFDEIPAVINAVAPPPPVTELCVITGMKARYRDPKTGKPYANLAAFKQLRAQFG
jgi:vacuolar protein sorting-associated protein 72